MTQVTNASVGGPEFDPGMGVAEVIHVGYREDVFAAVAQDRTVSLDGAPKMEEMGIDGVIEAEVHSVLQGLGEREQFVIASRFGVPEFPEGSRSTYAATARALGLSTSTIKKTESRTIEQLARIFHNSDLGYLLDIRDWEAGDVNNVRPILNPKHNALQEEWLKEIRIRRGEARRDEPEWTDEQRELQEQWFAEIRAKQEAGEIAFVRGGLLLEPLPEEVEAYLTKFRYGGDGVSAGLKAALQAVKEARDPEAGRTAKVGNTIRRANRLHSRVVSLEKRLAAVKEEFVQAVGEGAEALSESGYPDPEPRPEE